MCTCSSTSVQLSSVRAVMCTCSSTSVLGRFVPFRTFAPLSAMMHAEECNPLQGTAAPGLEDNMSCMLCKDPQASRLVALKDAHLLKKMQALVLTCPALSCPTDRAQASLFVNLC